MMAIGTGGGNPGRGDQVDRHHLVQELNLVALLVAGVQQRPEDLATGEILGVDDAETAGVSTLASQIELMAKPSR